MALSDTIYALSSGAAPSAIAIVRLSGPGVKEALQALTRAPLPKPRLAKKAALYHPQGDALLDRALILWFPQPASYSGEDMAELHLHGGPAVVASVLRALSGFKDFRLAEPGEFTRRAFHHGKLDLTEVEGLADLIAAETEAQARQALAQAGGALTRLAGQWREELANASARLEAALDFSDEGVPDEMIEEALKTAEKIAEEILRALKQSAHGERLRQGFTIVIVGAPNAGKSSLLNALIGREAAIVSARAGTTRDLIEVHLSLAGLPVTLVDTAGLSLTPLDELDEEAMRRARERAERADLRLVLIEPSGEAAPLPAFAGKSLRIASKADLPGRREQDVDLEVSAKTGAGLADLLERLAQEARQSLGGGESALVTRERQRLALVDCHAALCRMREAALPELVAEDYRLALRALGRLVGKVDVEELLDRIFRQFCIGK